MPAEIPMNLKNEFLSAFIVASTCKHITFFASADLWTNSVDHTFLRESLQGKVIMSAVTQPVSVV
jgi:hypothetical protein